MRLVIFSCTALLVVSTLSAQDTDRRPVDSTTWVPRAAATLDRLGITSPIQEQPLSPPIGVRKSVGLNPLTQSRASGESCTSLMVPYVAGGALLGVVAAGVGVAISFANSNVEFIGSPIAFAPLFVGSAGLGGLIGYFVYNARHCVPVP